MYLEPQTTINERLFQLDDSKSLHRKWLFHQTSTENWLFGVPGIYENSFFFKQVGWGGWRYRTLPGAKQRVVDGGDATHSRSASGNVAAGDFFGDELDVKNLEAIHVGPKNT